MKNALKEIAGGCLPKEPGARQSGWALWEGKDGMEPAMGSGQQGWSREKHFEHLEQYDQGLRVRKWLEGQRKEKEPHRKEEEREEENYEGS